jgi:hypothetical protein
MRRYGWRLLGGLSASLLVGGQAAAIESGSQAQALTGTAVVSQDYSVEYVWKDDAQGSVYGPAAVLNFRQKLYQGLTADLELRVAKAAGSDDTAELGFERAEITWVGDWCTVSGGRKDLGELLGPGEYFGAYATMGERQLDAAAVSFPFGFHAEIPDARASVSAPYNSVRFLYVPDLFSKERVPNDGSDGLILGQLRMKIRVGEGYEDVFADYFHGTADTFEFGSLGSEGGVDAGAAIHAGPWTTWLQWCLQSLSEARASQILSAGISADGSAWFHALFGTAVFEGQLPLGADPADPFTGGDPQDPDVGALPRFSWFAGFTKGLGRPDPRGARRLYYGFAMTNSPGDATLIRPAAGSLSVPVIPAFGAGPKFEGTQFWAANYDTPAEIAYVGYQF